MIDIVVYTDQERLPNGKRMNPVDVWRKLKAADLGGIRGVTIIDHATGLTSTFRDDETAVWATSTTTP
ncbi:Uncharacterised protein [Mycobacteroides abscessus]|uniref:hypothetical protein n=1 Tax=Mycobacteroides abscessus TaxID=36809 RepID=UPI0005E09F2D|nr:hypothetical protein [Mycobacteroides abscessus]CPT93961.1 Uncharacterised protein [Mycobacteroides abscessus]CPW13275.1 Uncharacterised protein [Mycobacteroides abscessus]CQA03594.1 Uncharacterised protein [Mycobacteroides abscessus]SHZ39443.1 Uncharacterised protein [Mycobacteroides abscessus subsp. abscessus]SHZ41279.1 Uncharacterised protein [Mycobacteroides abscessus subsp. abscessus]